MLLKSEIKDILVKSFVDCEIIVNERAIEVIDLATDRIFREIAIHSLKDTYLKFT